MAKAIYTGPAEKLELYEALVASVDGVDRKGAANPYTSRNGHMTSFIDKAGEVSIRLDQEDREVFMGRYDTELAVQYGSVMKEFVVVPDDLLERPDELREWFVRSWEWVGTLQPKPTKK
jgi:hypothetical protein